jgi:lysyl-tRNA synthetase class 1
MTQVAFSPEEMIATANASKAWPFQEAKTLWEKHLKRKKPEKGYVLFETGYGPSGLPHIGTFGEVLRTTLVRRAFEVMNPGIPTKLVAFSDDMDGLRKVPTNLPNQDMLAQHLHKPLTEVPDPFGTHESFAHHNNARLRDFLDSYGFEYDFVSSTQQYTSGAFNDALLQVLKCHDKILKVVLPTLGEERRATYSPFLPVCPQSRHVLQVPVLETNVDAGTIVYQREDGKKIETPVTDGHCKLQWKADWGMRWYALGVDYEMSGKDLIDSVKLSSAICRILGNPPPLNLTYELFLDDKGQKISKSKGNGLSMEEWLKYAPQESLALFMYQKPKAAKRLYFDVIPKNVDEYLNHAAAAPQQDLKALLNNPAWHIHGGAIPQEDNHLSFSILLNLANVCGSDDPAVLWSYISQYAPDATPENAPMLDKLVQHAIHYYNDFVKPNKHYRLATDAEVPLLQRLQELLQNADATASAEDLQSLVYTVGKENEALYPNLRDWFKVLYEVLLGQEQGPRMGSFIALYGIDNMIDLLHKAIAKEDLS